MLARRGCLTTSARHLAQLGLFTLVLVGCALIGEGPPIGSYYQSRGTLYGLPRFQPHNGIDLPDTWGADVLAAADGVVRALRPPEGVVVCSGQSIVLRHRVGDVDYYTAYCHLSAVAVTVGQAVRRGEVIGRVGTTGNSGGTPHLHFTVCTVACDTLPYGELKGTADPLDFIVGCFDPADPPAPTLQRDGTPRLTLTYPVRCRHRKKPVN